MVLQTQASENRASKDWSLFAFLSSQVLVGLLTA